MHQHRFHQCFLQWRGWSNINRWCSCHQGVNSSSTSSESESERTTLSGKLLFSAVAASSAAVEALTASTLLSFSFNTEGENRRRGELPPPLTSLWFSLSSDKMASLGLRAKARRQVLKSLDIFHWRWKDDDSVPSGRPGLTFTEVFLAPLSAQERQQQHVQHPRCSCQMQHQHQSLSQITIRLIFVLTECVGPARCPAREETRRRRKNNEQQDKEWSL